MNDLTGNIVQETSTALPSTVVGVDVNEYNSLHSKIAILESENARLFKENAELREKCMTRFARIKNAANEDEMAQMLHKIYMNGVADEHFVRENNSTEDLQSWPDIFHWLQEIGKI